LQLVVTHLHGFGYLVTTFVFTLRVILTVDLLKLVERHSLFLKYLRIGNVTGLFTVECIGEQVDLVIQRVQFAEEVVLVHLNRRRYVVYSY